MSEFTNEPTRIEQRAAITESALTKNGLLNRLAMSAEVSGVELSTKDVADIILPPKQPNEDYQARWELLEGAPGLIKEAATASQEEVFLLAKELDLRKDRSVDETDIERIDPEKSIWMIEGGANRTSVVRRQLAIEAIQAVYGERAGEQNVYQFGSDRPIPKERNGQPNAEYLIAGEIAGSFLPKEDSLTEFDLNVASAIASGYARFESVNGHPDLVDRLALLIKKDLPRLVMVQPKKNEGGLVDGINALYEMIMRENAGLFVAEPHFQPVIATNGQYRAKDELQADKWARKSGYNILPPVALGDEPGYKVQHNGKEIVTAERAPMAYINEIVVLHRLSN
jgi:hypothetical protein